MCCMKIVHCKCMYVSMVQEQGSRTAKQYDLMHVWGTLYRRHTWKTWESTGMALLRNLYKFARRGMHSIYYASMRNLH